MPEEIRIDPTTYSVSISGNDTEAELKNISCTAIQGRPEPSVTFYLGKRSISTVKVLTVQE